MSNAKAAAIAAYDAACAAPGSADWRAVANLLRAALPGARAASDVPAWFADYPLPKFYTSDSVDVMFNDGETIRANVFTARNKPPRLASTIRVAIAFYRARTGSEAVPAIASVTRVSDGASFDAATCSALTAALRSKDGARIEKQGPRAVTSESIARMTAELQRREAGLAVAADALADVMNKPLAVREEWLPAAESRVEMWQAAVTGGREELARMHAAYGAIETTEAAPAPITAPVEPLDGDDIAAGLSAGYGEPSEFELAGTLEWSHDSHRAVLSPATALSASAEKGLATDSHRAATAPIEAIAEPWRPSVATHPIVALCLSDKAREALEARVQDGTWRAAGRDAAGGAWRLTLADALDCQDIPSLRLVGMPRKPRRPRAAPPVVGIQARPPVEAIAEMPPAFMVPSAGRPHGAVTFHSAPVA